MSLYKHQLEAARFIVKRKGIGALYMEMGTGKTRVAIEIYKYFRQRNVFLKLLVVAPLSLLEAAWGGDLGKFAPDLKYWNIHDEGLPGERAFYRHNIFLINYKAFCAKKNLQPIIALAKEHSFMIVCDESSKMKNPKTQTAKTLLSVREYFRSRIIMSGTPAPNCEIEYWAQMEFLSPGILHKSFDAFRNIYFHLQRGNQSMSAQSLTLSRHAMHEIFKKGWKYVITSKSRDALFSKISPLIHLAKKKDCLDLPEQLDEVRFVDMSTPQKKAYKEMREYFITQIQGREIAVRVALSKILKLRQITSGFSYDENSDAREIKDGDTKLKELFALLEETGDQPVIIWCQFHWEIERICERMKENFVTLYGQTKNPQESIEAFQQGRAQYLIAHPRSAAHGLTFVNCSLEVFFSMDFSWEAYEQARARIHRAGQVNKCTYVHLLVKDTIDEHIYNVLKRKGSDEQLLELFLKGEKK